ncbi:MAG: hypothetical protein WKF61_01880 [Luteimonas sp.]
MCDLLSGNGTSALLDWQRQAPHPHPHPHRAHPTVEHLMLLFVALGTGGDVAAVRILHRSHEFGSLALECVCSR